jgi:hypothetical protein
MLQLLTTEEFAGWFGKLDDKVAEEVATALDVVERLGPERAAPGSRELLLWYEHPVAARFKELDWLSWSLEAWGCFRDYAERVLHQLESHRFTSRVSSLKPEDAARVFDSIKHIKGLTDPRLRWTLVAKGMAHARKGGDPLEDPCAELRRLYLAALGAAGFEVTDVPAHSSALREFAKRLPAPGFRLLYGVHAVRGVALIVLGEALDRSFYGDSVRRAEKAWKQFLEGELRVNEAAGLHR